jgi:hypothetical protein
LRAREAPVALQGLQSLVDKAKSEGLRQQGVHRVLVELK